MNRIKLSLLSIVVLSLSSGLFSKDLPNFSELAEKSSPAVVNITSIKTNSNVPNSFGERSF